MLETIITDLLHLMQKCQAYFYLVYLNPGSCKPQIFLLNHLKEANLNDFSKKLYFFFHWLLKF